jgi:hypothetical protein
MFFYSVVVFTQEKHMFFYSVVVFTQEKHMFFYSVVVFTQEKHMFFYSVVSTLVLSGVRAAQSLVVDVLFSGPLLVFSFFLCRSLYYLFFF